MTRDGCLNVFKEKGYTSHDVVAIIRKNLSIKAGHAGTLDPEAEGVLVVCLGAATKIADYVTEGIKGYRTRLRLGVETDTQDMTGNVLTRYNMDFTENDVKEAILSFVGEYSQIPPMYSALKVQGKKLYDLARQGVEVERKSRLVTILSIDNIAFIESGLVEMDVLCTKGTYIRTLCHDIGKKLNVGGAMESLLRFKSGKFTIEDSLKLEEIKALREKGEINNYIQPMEQVLDMDSIYVEDSAAKLLYNGNKIGIDHLSSDSLVKDVKYKVFDRKDDFIGIYYFDGYTIKPSVMLKTR